MSHGKENWNPLHVARVAGFGNTQEMDELEQQTGAAVKRLGESVKTQWQTRTRTSGNLER